MSRVIVIPEECVCSYDVTALFTSVPIDPALNIIRELLEQDITLWDRIVLSVQNIIELLGFCLHNTYFSFKIISMHKLKEQLWGPWPVPWWLTFIWTVLKRKPSTQPPTTQALVYVCGWHFCHSTRGL